LVLVAAVEIGRVYEVVGRSTRILEMMDGGEGIGGIGV
jgi:hypothetical protein